MIKLRNFRIGDEKSLFEVFYSSIHTVCSNDYTEEQVNAWAPDDLEPKIYFAKFRSINPFVALIDSKIVGYSDVQNNGLIDHFFVHGDYQKKGIGNLLMSEVLKRGAGKNILHSEVSQTAKPFFQKHGFKVVKQQTVKMRDVALNNNIMERQMNLTKSLTRTGDSALANFSK